MKISKIVSVALLLSASAYGQNSLQNAIKNTDNELFTEAEKQLKTLIASEPQNDLNYFYLGENFYAQKEKDSAVVYWKKAYNVAPNSLFAKVSLAKSLLVEGKREDAKMILSEVIKPKTKNSELLSLVAKTYLVTDTKNFDEIIDFLKRAIELDAKNETNYLLLGDALLAQTPTNGNNAIREYNKVLDINPKSPRGLVRIGKLYQRVNADSLANANYQEAQRIDPTYAPAYRENAELFLNINKPKKAIENWKKYLELNNSLEARYRYSTALFSGKQYCEAITELLNLKNSAFTNLFVERMLTYSYAECTTDKENANKGLVSSDEFFRITPTDKINYLDFIYKGKLLSNLGKDSLALFEYEKAINLDIRAKKDVSGIMASTYLKLKNYSKAIENYEYKRANDKLTPTELFELGRAHFVGMKNYVKADSVFMALNEVSPSFAPGHYWRALSNHQLDLSMEKWLAKPFYEKTILAIKVEDRLKGNNKKMSIESAQYLGGYYERSSEKDINKAKEYWKIVSELDPTNESAKQFLNKNK